MPCTVFCVQSNDPTLTPFPVNIDENLTIGDLKKEIRLMNINDLKNLDPRELSLIRIFTEKEGGLRKKDLRNSINKFDITEFGLDPDDEEDIISLLKKIPGACLQKNGCFYKFMNPLLTVKTFIETLPNFGIHVLVVVPSTTCPSRSYPPPLFKFKGSITNSKSVKGIRKSLYNFAQLHLGYYHPTIPAFIYNDDNIQVEILFESKQNAQHFQTEFESLSTSISNSNIETYSEIISEMQAMPSKRIFLKDYNSEDSDSPEDSFFSQSEFSEYQPTDDLVVYQSLEKLAFLKFGSEGAHLVSHKLCLKRKNLSLDKSENNRLALSRSMHGYVDGLANGHRPVVKLNYIQGNEEYIDGRYRVIVGVECLNAEVKSLVEPLLKTGSRSTPNPLIMECDVFVRDKDEFIRSLKHKSDETKKLWNELQY